MTKEDIIKIIEDLYHEIQQRQCGDSYVIDYNGNKISTDTAYAFEGIEFLIEELKHKLKDN